ncbi:MAG: TonB-dependent receptor plug domain-containing protein, partial [Prevotella sp.]|nr:TonB-dependent receptor plug domain-containing protein [Prevotella sp.]
MVKTKTLILIAVSIFNICYSAAQVVVSGKVVEHETQMPLPGATVRLLGSDDKTLTKEDGTFRAEVPNEQSMLEVSYVGMQSKKIYARDAQLVSLLRNDNLVLDEVVVIAYGQTMKSTFTGSAVKLQTEDLENRQVSNISQLLSGVSGVESYSSSGQPGLGASIRIRGIGSINAESNPLYVVDGMPFDGELATLNPSDIESVSVLKDASATALYGSRGANGVIIITTKKGKEGKARIEMNVRLGANSRATKNYDVMGSPQTYLETVYQAMHNAAVYSLNYSEQEAHMAANMFLPTNQNGGVGYNIYTVPNGESLIGTDGKLNPNARLGYSDGSYYYIPDDWQS